MHRYRFVLHRPLQLLPVLFGISIVTFVLIHAIPGDPVRTILGAQGDARGDRARTRRVRPRSAGAGAVRPTSSRTWPSGEMGRSIVFKVPVLGLVVERMQATLFLLGYGVVLALTLTCRSRSSPRSIAAAGRTT